MKSVLISIQPKWVEKIASGKKTVEVRKTAPKLEPPFKCYIYATRPKKWFRFSSWGKASDESLWLSNGKVEMCDGFKFWADETEYELLNGKVIGEFVCDKIFDICIEISKQDDLPGYPFPCTGLTDKEILQYLGNGKTGYGWHISDLVIYDKPKPLSDFKLPCKCIGVYEGETYCDCLNCEDAGDSDYGVIACDRTLKRPPQSWCYVEG